MNDRELLELAAEAAGYSIQSGAGDNSVWAYQAGSEAVERGTNMARCMVRHDDDQFAATRRAIVRAAAEIGKVMK